MSEYKKSLDYIHSLLRFGIKPGLERITALCAALGNPQDQLRCIHAAGTNGKGSVCTMLAGIAQASGMKTGLYTSPYVAEFRERIQINGAMIPKKDLSRLTDEVKHAACALPEPVTEFEFITALAFLWFARQGCDLVVLETGLGGRWDATNIIPRPLCSVIMKIALDHTEVLGSTLAEIAAEKCGIIKPDCPVISTCGQAPEALDVIKQTCLERNCELIIAETKDCVIEQSSLMGSDCLLATLAVHVPLMGRHMCENALTAVVTARRLGFGDAAIQAGIAGIRMPARMEVQQAHPPVILDGGHNPDGARALAAALGQHCPGQRFCMVCGMMADKDVPEYLRILQPYTERFIACAPENLRALPAEVLAALARTQGYENAAAAASPNEALRLGKASNMPLLVCGSFYLAGDVRSQFIKS